MIVIEFLYCFGEKVRLAQIDNMVGLQYYSSLQKLSWVALHACLPQITSFYSIDKKTKPVLK